MSGQVTDDLQSQIRTKNALSQDIQTKTKILLI